MKRRTWIGISKKAFIENIHNIRERLTKNCLFIFVVKANGYGVGLKKVVEATYESVDWYGVDSLEEANQARSICGNPIIILGHVSCEDAREVVEKGYRVLVYEKKLAIELARYATAKKPAKIHLKLDTGLSRLGLYKNEFLEFSSFVNEHKTLEIEGYYTHFAKIASPENHRAYQGHLTMYENTLKKLNSRGVRPRIKHVAESMATILFSDLHFDAVRIGIAAYGFWGRKSQAELLKKMGGSIPLTPTFTWKSSVVNVKELKKGSSVGYGQSATLKRDSKIGIVGAGFYDGVDKRYSNTGTVICKGKKVDIIGRISMNMFMVDLTDCPNVNIGEEIVLIGSQDGEHITIYEMADKIGTSTYEVMTGINPLLPRYII